MLGMLGMLGRALRGAEEFLMPLGMAACGCRPVGVCTGALVGALTGTGGSGGGVTTSGVEDGNAPGKLKLMRIRKATALPDRG
jgi:hypothetical protein